MAPEERRTGSPRRLFQMSAPPVRGHGTQERAKKNVGQGQGCTVEVHTFKGTMKAKNLWLMVLLAAAAAALVGGCGFSQTPPFDPRRIEQMQIEHARQEEAQPLPPMPNALEPAMNEKREPATRPYLKAATRPYM